MNNDSVGTRTLGTLTVSSQGLGCMGMSGVYGAGDEAESLATIDRAFDLGITFFDTANVYGLGHNEELLGRALKGRRDEAIVATKFAIDRNADGTGLEIRGDADYVRRSCEDSLLRLGIDTIDLYYQHRVCPDVPIEETIGAMAELVTEGKVRYLGMSEASADTIRRAHAVHPITALQSEWSLWTRGLEDEVVPTCRELGIGLVPYSPLGRGMLTGALAPGDLDAADWRVTNPRFAEDNFAANLRLVAALTAISETKSVTTAQLALAWVLHRGPDVVPIPGTKRRTYLEDNAAASAIVLSPEELTAIDEAIPAHSAAGDRYPASGMAFVNN